MKLTTQFAFSGDPASLSSTVTDLEKAGIDVLVIPEIYGFELVSVLGYVAAKTTTVELMTGIMPLYSRSPSLIAQTAATIDALCEGRFTLGLGTSGPQVIEGWHGIAFRKPLATTRDVVEICRKVWSRARVEHHGAAVTLPLPDELGTGLGKPLKFMGTPRRPDIPIVVAAIGPKNVAMACEIAEGWLPIFFLPDKFADVWSAEVREGLSKRAPERGDLQIHAGGAVALGAGPEVDAVREAARAQAAFYVGGMGAREKNFYNDLFKRYGWEQEALRIQDLFLDGRRDEATAAVPDEYVDMATLTGDEGRVRERIEAFREAGVTHLQITVAGPDKLSTIEKIKTWAQ